MKNEWNYETLLLAIHDTFDLIAHNENLLRMHQQYEDSTPANEYSFENISVKN